MIDLSVLVPGIHPQNWPKLYKSVEQSFSGSWEIIFIGPYKPPNCMKHDNIRYIQDWGSPVRCQQRGLCEAKGNWITWAADDGFYTNEALDICFEILKRHKFFPHVVITSKYIEGRDWKGNMLTEGYYILSNHFDTSYVPEGYKMLNVGVVNRKLLVNIGGWDCRFEACPMAYNDLAIRLQNCGANFILPNKIMFYCEHEPKTAGTHGPIHHAQVDHDQPLMREIYGNRHPEIVKIHKKRQLIDLDNWKNAPEKWERRFGNGKVSTVSSPSRYED